MDSSDDKPTNVVEFIPRDQYERENFGQIVEDPRTPGILKKELNRKRVVSAFMDAFELVGGTSRLVSWIEADDENYGKFLNLYARLLPSQSTAELEAAKETVIKHIFPPSKLDRAQ